MSFLRVVAVLAVVASVLLPVEAGPVLAQDGGGTGDLCDVGSVEQFSDVGASDYAAVYMLCMRALGLSQGRGDGSYGADLDLNRGQMASFLVRLWKDQLGQKCPTAVASPFTDTAGTTHEANINCLYGLGITQGTTATTYSPGDPLKASQISRFLFRTYRKAPTNNDQCPAGTKSELDEAVKCLLGLRVAPTEAEATSIAPVIRSQMAVYMIGLWHNLTGRGLPPTPPQISSPVTQAVHPIAQGVYRVAFSTTDARVWVADADGSNLEQIGRGYLPAWSPDGTRIAFVGSYGHLFSGFTAGEVWVVDADGSNLKQVSTHQDVSYPVWSPDGTRIAFSKTDYWRGEVFDATTTVLVADADGSNLKKVADGKRPVWSPDGSRIAFESEIGVWLVDADGSNLKQVSTFVDYPHWSPDGSRIAFFRTPSGLSVVNNDGSNLKHFGPSYGESWSPDGAGLAFYTSRREGEMLLYEVWVVDAGSNLKQVAYGKGPVWSPDSSRIAFEGEYGVWVVDADGSNLKQISTEHIDSTGYSDDEPVWSRDGTRIAFVNTSDELWVVDADGSNLKQLTTDYDYSDDPVWSPDSTRIAFGGGRHGGSGVWVVDADGSNLKQLLSTYGPVFDPVWSPGGSWIAFSGQYTSAGAWVVGADGSDLKQLTTEPAPYSVPVWSPVPI